MTTRGDEMSSNFEDSFDGSDVSLPTLWVFLSCVPERLGRDRFVEPGRKF